MDTMDENKSLLWFVMGEFSQANFASSWNDDLEIECQKLIDGDASVGFLASDEQLDWYKAELTRLHDRVRGWWTWNAHAVWFMSDSELKAYHAVEARYFTGYNAADMEYLLGDEGFVEIEHGTLESEIEFTDSFEVKHRIKVDQWVVRDREGKILVMSADEFAGYIKPREV